jgi:hypothetical protein
MSREGTFVKPSTPALILPTCAACGSLMYLMRISPIRDTRPMKVVRTYECGNCNTRVAIEAE